MFKAYARQYNILLVDDIYSNLYRRYCVQVVTDIPLEA